MPRSTISRIFASISARNGASGVLVSNRGTGIPRKIEARKFSRARALGLCMNKPQLIVAAAIAAALVTAAPAAAAPTWAPAGTATVHPGVQTVSDSGQCTSNFIFFDGANNVYVGQAAHCTSTGGQTSTNGCDTGSLPLGSPVEVDGASRPGTLAYNSWLAMQAAGETDENTCAYNDLALVKLDPADYAKVNPSIPFWGGPTGITDTTNTGDKVLSYGNSSLRFGVSKLSPKQGVVVQGQGNGWSRDVYTATPGIPGDSGSGFMDDSGRAIGVLSTVQIAPLAGSNGVGDLRSEVNWMHAHSSFSGVQLVNGTEAFNPDLVGAIGGA